MKWLPFLDTTESDAFAREIAEEFARNVSADATKKSSRQTEQRLAHAIEVIGNRAHKFNATHPLGWYKKSRFMNAIKLRLLEKGHAEELVDRVVYAVVLRTARSGLG